ncbi:MAG: hypothetical protein K0S09_1755 [Sphingobacteriaceae bacterium]|jgi:gliding motility-associated lipoprotein GldD|nr:hypothetical protein [Sphingobacteriaceae bacterium]
MRAGKFIAAFCFLLAIYSCNSPDYAPKPRGYFRINLPQKAYQKYQSNCPYTFDYPVYARVVPDSLDREANPCWVDIAFPDFNGRIHLSYWQISSPEQLNKMTEDAYELVYKNVVKATEINARTIYYPEKKVYGTYYGIEGNTASAVQFYLTDSTRNYLRGALYFHERPQADSIKPVLDFVKKDIDVMIKSLHWK